MTLDPREADPLSLSPEQYRRLEKYVSEEPPYRGPRPWRIRCKHGLERRTCMACQHRLLRNGRGIYRFRVASGGFRVGLNRVSRLMGAYIVVGDYAYCVKWA